MPFVERNILRVAGFEISGSPLAVALVKGMAQEDRAAAAPLADWVNTDHGQVPVEFRRMKAGHLFEDGENRRLLFPGHRPFQKLRDGAFVGLHVRWKPERRAFEAGEVVRAVMAEGPTCKRPDESGKVLQVMRRFWIHPARDGIRSESGDDSCNDGRFNGSGCDVDERRAAAIGSGWLEDEVGIHILCSFMDSCEIGRRSRPAFCCLGGRTRREVRFGLEVVQRPMAGGGDDVLGVRAGLG